MLLTFTVAAELPTVTVWEAIDPTAVGARLACAFTVTEMLCVAVKLPSLAVTVTVALPAAMALILTVEPDTLTAALLLSEEAAV